MKKYLIKENNGKQFIKYANSPKQAVEQLYINSDKLYEVMELNSNLSLYAQYKVYLIDGKRESISYYYIREKQNRKVESIVSRSNNMFYNKDSLISLCHGSSKIIKKPIFGEGEEDNDYGRGFYTVSKENIELAKEWACSIYNKTYVGVVNTYTFETENLRILNLAKLSVIHWIVLTIKYRNLTINKQDFNKLLKVYDIDLCNFDCIFGWRCDDTYSRIVKNFLSGKFTDVAISEAVKLGYLKYQFVLKSEESFNRIHFKDSFQVKDFTLYRNKFNNRKYIADNAVNELGRKYRNIGKYYDDYIEELT